MRIGQLSVYFGLFDEAMPAGFRETRRQYATAVGELLAAYGEVVDPGLVDSMDQAVHAAEVFAREEVDMVVFAPTMAAPPAWAEQALSGADVPVVVLGAQESGVVPDDYDTEMATARSLPVGLVMFTNVLVRNGCPFASVMGELGTPELSATLDQAMRAAAAVTAIRRRPIALVGQPMDGYSDVLATDDDLARLGVQVEAVTAPELSEAYAAVAEAHVRREIEEVQEVADAEAVSDEVLERSCRLSVALEGLCDARGLGGGAVNCHGPTLRWNPGVGITACLGVSRMSERGSPFACTGDVPTAIALMLGKAVANSALYCELYQLDLPGNWILVANGGEGDYSGRAPGSTIRLLPEDHYRGDNGPGVAVAFEMPVGPATLVSLTPASGAAGGWILVVAEGEVIGSRHHHMEGPNAMFRFSSAPVAEAYQRWCQAGATHHAALLPGARRGDLGAVADLLGIQLAAV